MRKTSLVVSTTLTALLAFASGPALAASVSIDDVNDSYVSTNLPDVPNAGERVENDADGNALLIELYSSTLHDPTATATDKAVAGQELAKLGIASSKDSATAPGVSPAAACPVSVGDPTQVASAGSAAAAACETVTPPTSKTLTVTWVQQSNGYYCGPASALMAIKQRGISTSRDGASKALTQANLAGSSYLNTTSSSGTSWASKRMHTTLNKWTSTSHWAATNAPSTTAARTTLLKSAFKNSVGIGARTVLANTVEYAGGGHYNGHPDRLIGHWIVGYAYSDSAAKLSFADPATGLSGYTGSQKFSISTSAFAPYLGNGIVA